MNEERINELILLTDMKFDKMRKLVSRLYDSSYAKKGNESSSKEALISDVKEAMDCVYYLANSYVDEFKESKMVLDDEKKKNNRKLVIWLICNIVGLISLTLSPVLSVLYFGCSLITFRNLISCMYETITLAKKVSSKEESFNAEIKDFMTTLTNANTFLASSYEEAEDIKDIKESIKRNVVSEFKSEGKISPLSKLVADDLTEELQAKNATDNDNLQTLLELTYSKEEQSLTLTKNRKKQK